MATTVVADVSLQKAVHSKWTHYIAQQAGPDKDPTFGIFDIAKVELYNALTVHHQKHPHVKHRLGIQWWII